MVDSTRKWRFHYTFGTVKDLNDDVEYIRKYLFMQKEYLSDEETAILEDMMSHYMVIQGNLMSLIKLQDALFQKGGVRL